MDTVTVARLKEIPEFTDVPNEQLQWLISKGETKTFADTEPLFEPDSGADFFLIILEGEFKTYLKVDSGRKFVNS
ncbi:MAG: CRP-like cAMP-binding protein, partial [Glaciecola sp.]